MVIPKNNVHTVHLHLTKSDLNLILQIKDQLKSHEGKQQVSVITLYIQRVLFAFGEGYRPNWRRIRVAFQPHFTKLLLFYQLLYKCFLHFLKDGEQIFLDLEVKLAKYAPPKWKEEVISLKVCFLKQSIYFF